MTIDMNTLADAAYKLEASDIHLLQDSQAFMRVDGKMRGVKGSELTRDELEKFIEEFSPPAVRESLVETRGADFGWQRDEKMRFRVAAYYERDRLRLVMRLIKSEIASLDDLGMPEVLKAIAGWKRGLTLVTGVTGSGKSTTLAAIIDHINANTRDCVITIEDPIETIHPNKRAVISQREVGRDVPSFRDGLIQALRQDPDVILIGEMRDTETISTALLAAETGHYVFSTMHTTNALHTLERILSEFPEAEHALLREQLANNLRATITQRLLPRLGGKGRCAAQEIMVVNAVIKKLMLDNRIPEIGTVIRGRDDGMMLFDQCIADLVRAESVDIEVAVEYVEDEFAFRRYVKGSHTSSDRGGGILG